MVHVTPTTKSTNAILNDSRGVLIKIAILSEEDDLERSTRVVSQYSIRRLNRSKMNISSNCSARERHFESN